MNDQDLDRLYERANACDAAQPRAEIKQAILAHAARVAAERALGLDEPAGTPAPTARTLRAQIARVLAALDPRMKLQIIAPLAAAVLAAVILVPLRWHSAVVQIPAIAPSPTVTRPAPAAPPVASAAASSPAPLAGLEAPAARVARERPAASEKAADAARDSSAAPAASIPPLVTAQSAAQAPAVRGAAPEARTSLAAGDVVGGIHSEAGQRMQSAPRSAANELHELAASGDTERLEVLLRDAQGRALLESRDAAGQTALMVAVIAGHGGNVATLLEHGADPNAADALGRTPLQAARERQETEIIDLLIRAGAR